MQLDVVTQANKSANAVDVSDQVFGCEYKEPLIHQVVVAFQAGARAGSKKQKTRSEVRGGGIKPWRQKGTGRARAGSIRSPIWVGGGRAFAARPGRSFKQKINKKSYGVAMRSIVSQLVRSKRMIVVDKFDLPAAKTKEMAAVLKTFDLSGRTLIINTADNLDAYLASRNIPNVIMIDVEEVNPYVLVGVEHVLVTVDALKKLEEKLQ